APATADGAENLREGARSWLHELAVVGWRGVGHDLVSAADRTVQALLAEPSLRRLAVLLDGFAAELRASSPVATVRLLPSRRWADLWTRALVLSHRGAGAGAPGTVSGRLLVIGAELREHGTVTGVQVHAVLEPNGGAPPRLVRFAVTAAKVDTIVGPATWGLLQAYPVLLTALAEGRAPEVTDVTLWPGGDLVWDESRAVAGAPADPFVTARLHLGGALAAPVPPLDRHPVAIAEPVLVEGHAARLDGDAVTFELDGRAIAVDAPPAAGPLTPALLAASTACLGLLRWDGAWSLRPLAVQAVVKKKPVAVHTADWALGPTDPKAAKAAAVAGDAVAVLRERAGRLLRR
ncbi:MAG TPA: hypothetical protein VGD67_04540, partial [Pseudonocardiaceae bacterium]